MTDQSFTRDKRLLTPADYAAVFEKNRRSRDASFMVLAHRRKGPKEARQGARLGLAIAKKNLKRAVDRNLVKRIVRESFRHSQTQLEGLDIVVLVQRNVNLTDRAALHQSLQMHWNKVEELCGRS